MIKHITLIASILLFFSCSKAPKDGPYIYFSNEDALADTISQSEAISIEITAIGNAYKVNRAQLFLNQTEYCDSMFNAVDSITIKWNLDFAGRINTQNILIQATDEHGLISTQTKKIYIQ